MNISMAAMPIASLRRKLRHVGEGVPNRRTMYFATVAWLTLIPSFKSSPWMRGAPHSGLALFICRMRSRTSRSTDGRPDPERQRQEPEALSVPLDHGGWLHQHHK